MGTDHVLVMTRNTWSISILLDILNINANSRPERKANFKKYGKVSFLNDSIFYF